MSNAFYVPPLKIPSAAWLRHIAYVRLYDDIKAIDEIEREANKKIKAELRPAVKRTG